MVKYVVLLLAVGALAGCAAEKPVRTQLMLVADTDIPNITRIEFSIEGPDHPRQSVEAAAGPSAPGPRSLGLLYTGGKLGPVMLTATGYAGAEFLLSRSARVYFVEGKTLAVPLHLVQACVDAPPCEDSEAQCTEGGCKSVALRDSDLKAWNGKVPGLADASNDAGAALDGSMSLPDSGLPDAGPGTDAGWSFEEDGGSDMGEPLPDGGIAVCDGVATDLNTDDLHCGSCDKACVVPGPNLHAENHCMNGKCVAKCLPNWENCDGKVVTGCEADLLGDLNCKVCGVRCVGNRHCVDGVCIK